MKKGKNRRYREARELKHADLRDPEIDAIITKTIENPDAADVEECLECRRRPHADWCMAEDA